MKLWNMVRIYNEWNIPVTEDDEEDPTYAYDLFNTNSGSSVKMGTFSSLLAARRAAEDGHKNGPHSRRGWAQDSSLSWAHNGLGGYETGDIHDLFYYGWMKKGTPLSAAQKDSEAAEKHYAGYTVIKRLKS